ncbi:NAD-dependent succinate-semialdehyde dehydrogenase [Bowmanella pacifica]|uniref:NAD-dependent succinate-semialdehyde dehydrogenase n=1 Tax=Bowmanella pacifica TaxID=502051 RepID=A0A917YSJ2_9ALTE|nr:NAD-dependent succinate-semialdehyde dehydrogenase [Bowmanella pacifica]GGO65231.1 NAD-dependent succinate-semialdehyde dehydrogenase [Bowmanella pacifica]
MTHDFQGLLKQGSYINGQWHQSARQFVVTDKANGEVLARVADAGVGETEAAIDAAYQAFDGWRNLTANQRSQYLQRWYQLMMAHQDTLGLLLTLEQGKPLAEAKGEIAYGAGFMQWFAEEAKRAYGDIIPAAASGQQIQVVKSPVGVVAAITPWNFPNAMIARKAAAALSAGCTFVVRPAAQTPLSALAMAELAEQAGIPAGVFNVIAGEDAAEIGKVLTGSTKVAKFSFTGSTRIGKILTAACATTIKRVSMELGGNAPFLVFDDADLDAAVKGAMASKFRNAGQTCVCANRFLLQASIAQAFTDKLLNEVKALKVGHGTDNVQIGPLISAKAAEDVHQKVIQSVAMGAKVLLGGDYDGGAFYPPTVVSAVTPDMPLFNQEIFGPVVAICEFSDEQQAMALANQTEYGLASYFYARDIGRVQRVADALQFGMVGINEGIISNPAAPFGGVKQSGYGREGSMYGLDDYMNIQYRCLGGLNRVD